MKKLIGGQDSLFPWVLHPVHLYEYGLELGLSAEELLHGAGLSLQDIDDVDLHITWQQYQLIADVVAGIASDWGFQFGLRLPVASHGLLGLLALNCVTWEQVVDIQENYPLLVSPIFYVQRRDTHEYCCLTIHPEFTRDPILRHSLEAYFSMFFQSVLQIGGEAARKYTSSLFVRVQGSPPDYAEEWRQFFDGQIEWNQHADQIWIHKDLLALPIPNADPVSANATRRVLQAQLNQLPANKGGLNELRTLFSRGFYKQEECAQQLFTTLPTLKRYLQAACTSFSRELTMYRMDEAFWEAAHTECSMSELSERLGFRDVNSFGRLFKKEAGVSFTDFRQRYQ
ncbi:MAG: AraC family transcriptional regulator ligand-binding domain-containing protein [Anaerolineae bacterium]|nr:AraC family transcriptional regulator ligand-binding domain-containing protein [Anaerolineae bacterium]